MYAPSFSVQRSTARINCVHAALISLSTGAQNNRELPGTAAFYRAMSLFRQGKQDDARQLATAAATMKPLPTDEQNPLAGDSTVDELIL